MKITAYYNGKAQPVAVEERVMNVVIPESSEEGFLEIRFERELWDKEEYVLLPGAVYNGNRFDSLDRAYPPMFTPEEAKVDMPVTITNAAARLNKDGSGRVVLASGEVTVPCIGVFDKKNEMAYLIFTEQEVKNENVSFSYEEGILSVSVPRDRRNASPSGVHHDTGIKFEKGEIVTVPYCLIEEKCQDLPEFYKIFSDNRKIMGLDDTYTKEHGSEEIFRIQEEKFNTRSYSEELGVYAVGAYKDYIGTPSLKFQFWQPGWVGGAMTSYPLMKCGSRESYERGMKTLDFLFSTQKESGFFAPVAGMEGEEYSDAFGMEGGEDWLLLRKAADVLLFLYKHFTVIQEKGEEIPERFVEGTRKLADAFVKMWEKYGQFGQFVSMYTGDIAAGGSCSAAIASAGLAKIGELFKDETYMKVAEASGEYFYQRFIKDGCTTGGPGEILQCPDSESAFGFLESMVTLAEVTGDKKWVSYAKAAADYCSSWVFAYNYKFPENSEFRRVDIKTTGSVFANAQNKHSGPGICTLSGDSLYRLFKMTGEKKYLELIKDIANGVFQYISREDRPIRAKLENGEYKALPAGYVNERVNTSDWEGQNRVGEVFYGSTWAETSALLTWVELREILVK